MKNMNNNEQIKKRNGFGSGLGFVFAAAGSAVGLGNLWSFPYKTSANGGAAFVCVYILSTILIGLIIMIAEMYIGKRAQANPVSAYKKINSKLGWLGLFSILIPFIILCYYSILGGYTLKFTVNSFNQNSQILQSFASDSWQVILFTLIFIVMALTIVMFGVKGGIERASKVLMPSLVIILLAVVVYCLTLGEGVKEGLTYYLKPDFKELGFKGVLAAMGQSFFSLSLGMGITISYGSYTGKNINLGKSAVVIAVFDVLIAFIAGLAIFPAIYHYKAISGINLQENGILLLFSSLPAVFDSLGVFGGVISFFFFGVVAIAAITSVISLFEVVTQFAIQKFKVKRKKAITVVAVLVFIFSIPISISLGYSVNGIDKITLLGYNLLDFIDVIANMVLMPLCALGSAVAIGWCLNKPTSKKDIINPMHLYRTLEEDGLKLGVFGKFFAVMIKYITPLCILLIEVFGIYDLIIVNGKFDLNGLFMVLIGVAIIIAVILIYIKFYKNTQTGENSDEFEINAGIK